MSPDLRALKQRQIDTLKDRDDAEAQAAVRRLRGELLADASPASPLPDAEAEARAVALAKAHPELALARRLVIAGLA